MILKLISKSQVRLLEFEGNPSRDYKEGYCRAINDVLDLEPIRTLGVDELGQIKKEIERRADEYLPSGSYDGDLYNGAYRDALYWCFDLIDSHVKEQK